MSLMNELSEKAAQATMNNTSEERILQLYEAKSIASDSEEEESEEEEKESEEEEEE